MCSGKRVRSTVVSRPWVQVSRLGNPLVNEVIIPTAQKDAWNRSTPSGDSRYVGLYTQPVLAALINQLYPGVVNAPERNRDDLVSVLLTGVPNLNFTGQTQADMLRLNLSIAPTSAVGAGNRLGVFGNDLAGFPNGRRLEDDVIDIAERAVAGKLKGNPNADALGDGVNANDVPFLATFPYQADPVQRLREHEGPAEAVRLGASLTAGAAFSRQGWWRRSPPPSSCSAAFSSRTRRHDRDRSPPRPR